MKLPLDWVREFIPLSWSATEIADRLIELGIGVEEITDQILTVEITPNRGDWLSILGVARELAAVNGKSVTMPAFKKLPAKKPDLSITVDTDFTPRYTSVVLKGVTVAPTKNTVITKRLAQAGMRSVNNIVDVTNYVMVELGQPTHAFDYDKIAGKKMVLGPAKKGDTLITLDGVRRTIPRGGYVIRDGSGKVIDLPGIMGGKNSAIDRTTKNIVLQAAALDGALIRKVSKSLGLVTEASYRFERFVDPAMCQYALTRLVELVQQETGGSIEGLWESGKVVRKSPIQLPISLVKRLLGKSYQAKQIVDVFTRLGMTVTSSGNTLAVTPPTWRHDLSIAADLVEELARIIGYSAINSSPLPNAAAKSSTDYWKQETWKDQLMKVGFSEVMTTSLVSRDDLDVTAFKPSQAVELANPFTSEQNYFRPTLLIGLLKAAAKNPTFDPVKIFEIGHVATKKGERSDVGLLWAGKNAQTLAAMAKIHGLQTEAVTKSLKDHYKIRKQDVYVALGPWERIAGLIPAKKVAPSAKRIAVKPLSKFATVSRDISFIVSADLQNADIEDSIGKLSDMVYQVELFDEFTGPQIGEGKKSLAFHIHYQNPEKTMTGDEIDTLHKRVAQMLQDKYNVRVR